MRELWLTLILLLTGFSVLQVQPVESQGMFYVEIPWHNMILETPGASIQLTWKTEAVGNVNINKTSGAGSWEINRKPTRLGVVFTGNNTGYALNMSIRWVDPVNESIMIIKQSGGKEIDYLEIPVLAHTVIIGFGRIQTTPRPEYPTAEENAEAVLRGVRADNQQRDIVAGNILDRVDRAIITIQLSGIGIIVGIVGVSLLNPETRTSLGRAYNKFTGRRRGFD